jgi:hypothetical protein
MVYLGITVLVTTNKTTIQWQVTQENWFKVVYDTSSNYKQSSAFKSGITCKGFGS